MQRAAIEKLPGLIFTFVFEPAILPGFYERLTEAIESAGGTMHPIELHYDPEENLRRVLQPDRDAYRKTKDTEMVRSEIQSEAYLAPSELSGNIIIDITNSPPPDTARLITERLDLR